eukprot:c10252_g1_i1.p1 GENE.c10252_g1_i1~~c10252_g1_i1.p1  ORF type:complete len:546 (+),score=105.22 c10252_g1_i1:2-1639(+)
MGSSRLLSSSRKKYCVSGMANSSATLDPVKVADQLAVMWLFVTGLYMFFMLIGIGMVEVGSSHRKNSKTAVVKNICSFGISATCFWFWLRCLAQFGLSPYLVFCFAIFLLVGFLTWYFRFAFATICSTVVSGGVAERSQFLCSIVCTMFVTGFVHPVAAHWVWGGGWLQSRGVIDTSGCGVVSLLGGVAGIVGSVILGPRVGRFEGQRFHVKAAKPQPFSPVFHALGVLIVWTGWYGLNSGAASALVGLQKPLEIVAINTALAPSAATLSVMVVAWLWSGCREIPCATTLNGVVAGLIAISSSVAVVSPALAFVVGFVAGPLYFFAALLLQQLKIDDPLDMSCLHLTGGLWGLIATGLFATEAHARQAFPSRHPQHYGLFFGGGGQLLGWQLSYACAIICWGVVTGVTVFGFCHFLGILRVSKESELYGLDSAFYGSPTKHERKLLELITATRGVTPNVASTLSPAAAALHYQLQLQQHQQHQQQVLQQQQEFIHDVFAQAPNSNSHKPPPQHPSGIDTPAEETPTQHHHQIQSFEIGHKDVSMS